MIDAGTDVSGAQVDGLLDAATASECRSPDYTAAHLGTAAAVAGPQL